MNLLPRHSALVLTAPGTVSVLAGHDQKWLGSDFSIIWELVFLFLMWVHLK